MKRQPIEVYGFGPRLPTRPERLTSLAGQAVVALLIIAILVCSW